MKLFNTLSKAKEEFIPLEPGKVKMYACGPTVYNYIHIGNARPFCVFDTLRRYLEYKGYEVTFVQNFTDVDDKIIQRANEQGIPPAELANTFIEECLKDAQGLGVRPPTIAPRATQTMNEIIEMIQELEQKGFAYEKDGDVYFRSLRFSEYGEVSHQPIEDLEAGKRIEVADIKEDPIDFALWKKAKPDEPFWDSPWGKGRPGWHIECSAMIKKHLGETIDIHGGGQDLIFPHHENENAQSCCCNDTKFVNYWVHNGYINVDNKKMSKSLGNFFTVREVAEQYGYETIKMMMQQAHYRSPLSYSVEVLEQSKAGLERLYTCREHLDFCLKAPDDSNTSQSGEFLTQLESRKVQFEQAMDDDLNTADGMAALFDLVRDCNIYFETPRPSSDLLAAAQLFDTLSDVLGILYNRGEETIDQEVEDLIEQRQQARKDKDFAKADAIRDQLKEKGIVLEDTPQGVKWHRE